MKVNTIETDLATMEKNHALGKVREDIFNKYWAELMEERNNLLDEYEKLNKRLSNPDRLIDFTCNMSANLSETWRSSSYYRKQMFQSTLFPQGLAFDSKINDYRTPVVNLVIARNAELSRSFA